MSSGIVLIDAGIDSLTVSWPDPRTNQHKTTTTTATTTTTSTTASYHLQYRRHHHVITSDTTTTSSSCCKDETLDPCGDDVYMTLSKSVHTTLVRKKNLIDPDQNGFIFRVRPSYDNDNNHSNNHINDDDEHSEWMTHTEPFYLLTQEQVNKRMIEAPSVIYGGTNASLRISWKAPVTTTTTTTTDTQCTKVDATTTATYEIQMRENMGGVPWTTIATTYTTTEVRKKNLTSTYGYQFRIRPNDSTSCTTEAIGTTTEHTNSIPFSPPSEPVVALSYNTTCTGLQRLFTSLTQQTVLSNAHLYNNNSRHNNTTKKNQSNAVPVPVAAILGGKEFILLYVSAHWCGPCRQYTPKLMVWYQQQQQQQQQQVATSSASVAANAKNTTNESAIEIVFVSADHDVGSFQSYYSSMPWTAIDYEMDATTREQFMSYLRVTGIPQLAVLNGRTGAIIENNAVHKSLDIQRWRTLVSK